ncbi:MAG: hypothetical protein K9N35_01595 [Candidatus Marinimicrobia bacterium]|nr:hypothetical protein [Candidatus Neomarinimicrobiota bacterium]
MGSWEVGRLGGWWVGGLVGWEVGGLGGWWVGGLGGWEVGKLGGWEVPGPGACLSHDHGGLQGSGRSAGTSGGLGAGLIRSPSPRIMRGYRGVGRFNNLPFSSSRGSPDKDVGGDAAISTLRLSIYVLRTTTGQATTASAGRKDPSGFYIRIS